MKILKLFRVPILIFSVFAIVWGSITLCMKYEINPAFSVVVFYVGLMWFADLYQQGIFDK